MGRPLEADAGDGVGFELCGVRVGFGVRGVLGETGGELPVVTVAADPRRFRLGGGGVGSSSGGGGGGEGDFRLGCAAAMLLFCALSAARKLRAEGGGALLFCVGVGVRGRLEPAVSLLRDNCPRPAIPRPLMGLRAFGF